MWAIIFTIAVLFAMYTLYKYAILFAEKKFTVIVLISKVFKKDKPLSKIFPEIIELISTAVPDIVAGGVVIFNDKGQRRIQAVASLRVKTFESILRRIPREQYDALTRAKQCITLKLPYKNYQGVVLCPLRIDNTVVGAMVLLHERSKLPQREITFLNTLSSHCSIEFQDRLLQTKLEAFSKGLSMVEYSYEKIVDNLPSGVVAIDPKGLILLWNKKMEEVVNLAADKVIGTKYTSVFPPNQALEKFLNDLLRTNMILNVDEYQYNNHVNRLLQITGYPLFDMHNKVIAYVIMHRDITNERKLQKQLRQTQEHTRLELQKKVELATKELKDANTELIRLNKIKSEFVSTISHELKTPLTSIKGYISLLNDGTLGQVSGKQKDALKVVNEQSDRLNVLINDVLDLSRLEAGKSTLHLEKVNLSDVMNEAIRVITPQANEKGIEIEKHYAEKTVIGADKMKLHQVFLNLLSNGVKFSPNQALLQISITLKDEIATIEVEDSGIGIEPDQLKHLFEPFYQVEDHMTRKVQGTGLGLTIVKHIVELHNGQIGVMSEVGKGTTFTITLPREQ